MSKIESLSVDQRRYLSAKCSDSTVTSCTLCHGPLTAGEIPYDSDELDLVELHHGVEYIDLCDRCDFVKRTVEHCVKNGIFIAKEMDGDMPIATSWMMPRTWKWFQWYELSQKSCFEMFVLPGPSWLPLGLIRHASNCGWR